MKDFLRIFRGDQDKCEVTLPMKCLLGSFGITLSLVVICLYVMCLDNVSDHIFTTFTQILVVDLVLMVFTDVLIVVIWFPSCFSKDKQRDKSDPPSCAIQCLPIISDSVSTVPNDVFKDISVGELSRRLGDLHDEEVEDSMKRRESLPSGKPVGDAEVQRSLDNPNLDQNGNFPKYAPVPASEQSFVYMRGPQQRGVFNPQREGRKVIENFTHGFDGEQYELKQGQSDTLSRHFSVPAPTQRGFWHHRKQQYYLATNLQKSMGDSKRKERSTGGATQCEPKYANQDQNDRTSSGQVSKPVTAQDVTSQKGFWYHEKQQYLAANLQQSMGDSKGKDNSIYTGDGTQCEPKYGNQDRASRGQVCKPVASKDEGFAGCVKLKNPSAPPIMESRKDSTSRSASGVDQSCQRTDVSQDRNGTSSGRVSREDGLRRGGRHPRKRFWSEPRPSTSRDSAAKKDDEGNLSSESLDEVIKNRDDERLKRYEVKPTVRGFVKLKKRFNRPPPYYFEGAARDRLFATSSLRQSRIDDALRLTPISDESKQFATAAWVSDHKNQLPPSNPSPSFKRSRSAPPNRTRRPSPTSRSPDPSTTNNRLPIPACAGDSRHRVLHRLLATILTTGDDVMAAYPELENDELEDAPKMEVEALPSGDYVMYVSMRLTSKELQNFKSRRATNFKDSEFKKYLATLC